MRISMIRHGMTKGNRLRRYIGCRTDESLCEAGRQLLLKKELPMQPDILYVSPMLRCRQTAEILFPNVKQLIVDDFREMDFGIFENQSFDESLKDSKEYRHWVDSGCELKIPEGESKTEFIERTCRAFSGLICALDQGPYEHTAIVAHGGTIMSLMYAFACPERDYYEWGVKNGQGFTGEWNGEKIVNITKIY